MARTPGQSRRRIDVIVCVHDALEEVRLCLESVVRGSSGLGSLLIVNDASRLDATEFLRGFAQRHACCELIENRSPRRYTRAANQGIRASTAESVVLLNSDTVVPPGWLARLSNAMNSGPKVGMTGPLSNAAGYQSVPRRGDGAGDWAVNVLPPGWNIAAMDTAIQAQFEEDYPRVPFLNGFCLMIDRRVINSIGLLDEVSFPEGFGEEDDYCIRARDAGFELVVACDTYVHHWKSKSYAHDERRALSARGRRSLKAKYGEDRVEADARRVRQDPVLAEMRSRVAGFLRNGPNHLQHRARGTQLRPDSGR